MRLAIWYLILCDILVQHPIGFNAITKSPSDQIQENVVIHSSTFDVLYITPGGSSLYSDTFTLNQKHLFGGSYDRGWLLPSDQPIDLDLYIFYDGQDESKIRPFLNPKLLSKSNSSSLVSSASSSIPNGGSSNDSHHHYQQHANKYTLTLYFTPEDNCEDYMRTNYRPFEIVDRIASNLYKAQLTQILLPYSERPLYICMQQFDLDENIHDQYRYYSHQGNDYWVSIVTTKDVIPTWARIILFFILLSFSGLFSGLNLGLMSLDLAELDILKRIGTPEEKSYASKIYPLRKRGNFLLCTILLGNVLVNSVSTLLLGDMLSGVYAAFGSTLLIVIFGEIIPQAACSKHGLAIGANTRFIMYVFMVLTSPLSFPLSIILDKILGQEIAAPYNREKIRELMNFVEGLDNKEKKIISGALDFNKKKVREVMTPIENVFMLELHSCLGFEAIARIAQEGFSRIPVYEGEKENVVGLLHVKDFTLLDPDDNMPVEALLKFYNHPITYCDAERYLDSMFDEFRKGETHLAFVQDVFQQPDRDPVVKVVGIVTLEDILEELVQMEIYDEFDDKRDIERDELNNDENREARDEHDPKDEKSQELDPLISKKTDPIKSESIQMSDLGPKSDQENLPSNELVPGDQTHHVLQQQVSMRSNKSAGNNNDTPISKDLSFFLQQQKDASQRALISPQIRFVMFQFLFTTVRPFTSEFLTKNVLELIFKKAVFKESKRIDQKLPPEYLYRYGRGCHYFILILSGEATIEVGKERLEFPAGPFAYFGENALLCGRETVEQVIGEDPSSKQPADDPNPVSNNQSSSNLSSHSKLYIPDFSLRVDDRCVYMKIDHNLWRNGVIKSQFERQNNQMADSIDYIGNEPNELSDPSKISGFPNTPNNQLGVFKENFGFTAYHPSSPNRGGPKARRSTITTSILTKVQQASDARLAGNTPQQQRLFSSSRIKEPILESDPNLANNDDLKSSSQEQNVGFYVTTPTKDFSTSCSNIDESSANRRRTIMDKQKSFDN